MVVPSGPAYLKRKTGSEANRREKPVEKGKVFEGSFPPMSLFFQFLDIAKEKLGANWVKSVDKEKLAAAEEHEEEGKSENPGEKEKAAAEDMLVLDGFFSCFQTIAVQVA